MIDRSKEMTSHHPLSDAEFAELCQRVREASRGGPPTLPLIAAIARSLDGRDVEALHFRGCELNAAGLCAAARAQLVAMIDADPAQWASLLAPVMVSASSDDPAIAALVARVIAVSEESARVALRAVAAAVGDREGDFALRKPAGLRPDMPLFAVIERVLRGAPSPEQRALARRVAGPWSWTADELALAMTESREDERPSEEIDALARYSSPA